ncbi:MAG: hemerythrin domain-containing protein [Gemmatimonadetes bacterium]|nr:hemerythrin domain-containing protein [Gemmatimonadota bacterium]MBI2535648.1 hemerythrin domain-containing protein [Gemmatimonadota bacterium]MBI2615124.1 hemerythrin domain-containing protein [Gemmatimonadota bacterium]
MKRHRKAPPKGRGVPRISEQHQELRHALELIDATEDLTRLVPLLQGLRGDLAAHFADEEGEDGLAQAVGPAAPHHLRRLEALLAEHAQLLASLDDVIERGDALLDGSVKQVVDDARALTRRLARHEAAETALLTDAVYSDIGGG